MQDQTIKTRPDGSIDTAFYMQRGRIQRSEAAHQLVKGICDEARVEVPETPGFFQSLFQRRAFAS